MLLLAPCGRSAAINIILLFPYRLYNIPACYLGSAQTNNAEAKAGVLRYN